jgi:putative N6-adenine-specific DNA methylase
VDVEQPMLPLNLHIYRNEAVLSLDSSGESLHKRGYRPILTKAPLNEALAAALVLLTGFRGETALVDPLCGSGTLPIEAAWIALRRPPGLTRRRFAFQSWLDFDVGLWAELRDKARGGVRKQLPAPILGSDVRRDAIQFAVGNARAAGLGKLVPFEVKDIRDFRPPPSPPGIIVCNPPYGERIGEEKELQGLYRTLGEVFRERAGGWTAYVFTGNARLARHLGLEPAAQVPLFNGKIPCRLLRFTLP